MLDTDIVIIGDLLHLFNEEFDYGLSARGNLQVPVQGGVQLVHKGHLDRAEQWLSLVLDLWDAKAKLNSRGEYGFTGDQHIYADAMVGMGGDRTPIMNKASAKGTSHMPIDKEGHGTFDIMLIPADRYNRNPGGAGAALAKERVAVLHYKGGRKDGMYKVWNPMRSGGLKAVYKLKSIA